MSRGNQRDKDRARAQKRKEQADKRKGGKTSDYQATAMTSAEIMRAKQRAAEERKALAAASTTAESRDGRIDYSSWKRDDKPAGKDKKAKKKANKGGKGQRK